MTIIYNGDLNIGNLQVQDLVGLSEDEIKERIAAELPHLTATQVDEQMEELNVRLSEIEDELKELQDGYEEDLDNAQDDDNVSSIARYESKLEEVEEALESLDTIDA